MNDLKTAGKYLSSNFSSRKTGPVFPKGTLSKNIWPKQNAFRCPTFINFCFLISRSYPPLMKGGLRKKANFLIFWVAVNWFFLPAKSWWHIKPERKRRTAATGFCPKNSVVIRGGNNAKFSFFCSWTIPPSSRLDNFFMCASAPSVWQNPIEFPT